VRFDQYRVDLLASRADICLVFAGCSCGSYYSRMEKGGQSELLAGFIATLAADDGTQPVNRPADVAAASAGLSAGAVGWAVGVSSRCADAVRTAMGVQSAWLPEDETRRAIEMSVLAMLRHVAHGAPAFPLDPDQVSVVRNMARRGRPYDGYIEGLRLVQAVALEALLDRAAAYGPAQNRSRLAVALAAAVTRFFDQGVSAIVSEFLAERQRALAAAAAERGRVASALIAGQRVPEEVAERTLGISLGHHHLSVIFWSADPGARAELEATAARAAGALHATGTLILPDPSDDAALLCWISRLAPLPGDWQDVLDRVSGSGVRAAAGSARPGAAGFRRSHLEARDARRAARQGLPGRVIAYRDIDAVALLNADAERAQWFVTDQLGGLAADSDVITDLRATALCYLERGHSLVQTAAALNVHRNTILYRLASIERLLGRPLAERPFPTLAALTLIQRFGPELVSRDFAPRIPAGQPLEDGTPR
jgi:DNA-binding PucR family transcriptional regulator